MKNRFEIPCEGGVTLVAERNPDPNYSREIYIFLMDTKTQAVTQDLAIVRQAFKYPEFHGLEGHYEANWLDKFEVLVYADSDNEDYTNRFSIDRHDYGEEE